MLDRSAAQHTYPVSRAQAALCSHLFRASPQEIDQPLSLALSLQHSALLFHCSHTFFYIEFLCRTLYFLLCWMQGNACFLSNLSPHSEKTEPCGEWERSCDSCLEEHSHLIAPVLSERFCLTFTVCSGDRLHTQNPQ